jgi:hypothetical protein
VDFSPFRVAHESAAVVTLWVVRVEEAFFSCENRLFPKVGVALILDLKLTNMSDIYNILSFDLSIWVLVDSESVLLVYVDDSVFVRAIGSVQFTSETLL